MTTLPLRIMPAQSADEMGADTSGLNTCPPLLYMHCRTMLSACHQTGLCEDGGQSLYKVYSYPEVRS